MLVFPCRAYSPRYRLSLEQMLIGRCLLLFSKALPPTFSLVKMNVSSEVRDLKKNMLDFVRSNHQN